MIGIIGAGNMGSAIASRLKERALISDIKGVRARLKKSRRILAADNNIDLVKRSEIVILAVKPQDISGLLKEIRPYVKGKLIVSIAAGVEIKVIEKILKKARVIRVMPNMPALVGKGITAITRGRYAGKKDIALSRKIFSNLGEVVEVKETLMDVVTALSGSGPAYYFLFTDMLEKAGCLCGLKKGLAERLSLATFIGSAAVADNIRISMGDFVKKVASKGGTTEAALKIFKDKGLERIVTQAVRAACVRSRNLKKKIK